MATISTRCASFHISFQWQQKKVPNEIVKWKIIKNENFSHLFGNISARQRCCAYMKIRERNFQWNVKERKRCARGNFSLKSPFLRQRWLVRVEWLTIDFSRATCCVSSVGRSSSDGQHIPTYIQISTLHHRPAFANSPAFFAGRLSFSVLLKTPGKSIHMKIAEEKRVKRKREIKKIWQSLSLIARSVFLPWACAGSD